MGEREGGRQSPRGAVSEGEGEAETEVNRLGGGGGDREALRAWEEEGCSERDGLGGVGGGGAEPDREALRARERG